MHLRFPCLAALALAGAGCGDDLPPNAEFAGSLYTGDPQTAGALDDPSGASTSPGPVRDEPADDAGVPSPSTESLHFLALGDSGEGNENQFAVARAAETVCEERGCDFALLLGDNFYDVGVTSVDDVQFKDKFEEPYEGLDIPFYVVLGNHDYGVLANDWPRGDHQVQYAEFNPKWVMPHFWYTFTSDSGQSQFFALDTQRIMFNHELPEQRAWFEAEIESSQTPWKIAFAHHPYLSNGEHGNAGNYEGLGLSGINGTLIKRFVDDLVCGNVDVYFSGHDHNRQTFDPVCGTYFFVSGAAAKTTGFKFRDENPPFWGDDTRPGFAWVEIEGDLFTAVFYDLDGNLDHEMSFTR